MMDVDEAQRILLDNVSTGETETVALADSLYRTLVEPVRCDIDFPPFDRSVMDGYAVRAADTVHPPVRLRVIGQIPAGTAASETVGPRQAMQINTGAPLPSGADAVVRVESTERSADGATVTVQSTVEPGTFITPRATYVSAQQVVIPALTRLGPLEISAAAAAGAARVRVFCKPKVAILVSGDELVEIDQKPSTAQIRDSNRYLLEALVRAAHAEPVLLGVAGDDKKRLREKIEEGLEADVLCITGGVSVGEFDFVPDVLHECGATIHVPKIAIKPGRPTIFATGPCGTPIFALPGNPGSALIGFLLLVKPALAALEGRCNELPRFASARLRGSIKSTTDRRSYIPARWNWDECGMLEVEPVAWSGSGDTFGWITADALIMRPPHSKKVTEGDTVLTIPLDPR